MDSTPSTPSGARHRDDGARPLRRGWTTGACATAAAKAAYAALLGGAFPDPVTVRLPRGLSPSFPLHRKERGDGWASAAVIKDAGDDPDVTHGAEIVVRVRPGLPGSGVTFRAGDGVGTVTRPGLPVPPGEPAINPGPRTQMGENLAEVAAAYGLPCDVEVTVSVPGGAALAEKTMNPRLGIVGGISILGTTGVVIPYSCSSWIHAIQRGVDVARAAECSHLAGATGRTSEAVVQRLHGLPDVALIDMGDFAGALLKYLRRHPVPRLTIGGGFAKLSKLAGGAMDLHSSRTAVDFAFLSGLLRDLGADAETVAQAVAANTTTHVQTLAADHGLPLAEAVAARARETALAVLAGGVAVDVVVVDRNGRILAHVGP